MRTRKSKETDYLYASARVRAAENRLIGMEKAEAAIASKGTAEIEAIIAGIKSDDRGADKLGAYLGEAYSFVGEISPDENISSFLRYGYDCNNIKAALKCHVRETDCGEMMFSFGSVSVKDVLEMPKSLDFSALPKNMQRGAEEALEAYSKTGDPQLIDIILDKACFLDMLEAAEASGEKFAVDVVKTKIDLINLMMCIRILRMGAGEGERDILLRSLLTGGYLSAEKLYEASISEENIAALLNGGEYSSLAPYIAKGESLASIEKRCDDLYMNKIKQTRSLPFGAPLLIAYLIAVEYEVKNLRIILAGKRAGLSPEKIRERVRVGYV